MNPPFKLRYNKLFSPSSDKAARALPLSSPTSFYTNISAFVIPPPHQSKLNINSPVLCRSCCHEERLSGEYPVCLSWDAGSRPHVGKNLPPRSHWIAASGLLDCSWARKHREKHFLVFFSMGLRTVFTNDLVKNNHFFWSSQERIYWNRVLVKPTLYCSIHWFIYQNICHKDFLNERISVYIVLWKWMSNNFLSRLRLLHLMRLWDCWIYTNSTT